MHCLIRELIQLLLAVQPLLPRAAAAALAEIKQVKLVDQAAVVTVVMSLLGVRVRLVKVMLGALVVLLQITAAEVAVERAV
jgi:hypothetical protein